MRTLGSGLSTLIAIVAVICAIPSFWTHQRLIDSAGFRSMSQPLGHDRAVQDAVADELVAQITADNAGGAASALVVKPLVTAYTRGSDFPSDLSDVLGQQHDWLFDAPTAREQQQGTMQLDLTAMVNRAIASQGIGVTVRGPITVALSESRRSGLEAGRYHQIGQRIDQIAVVAAGVAVIAAFLALVIARRRGLVLCALGFGVVVAGGIAWLLGALLRNRAYAEVSGAADSARRIADRLIDRGVDDLHHTGLITGGVGVAMVAIGLLVSLTVDRRRTGR
ncbi:hypothetical protein [Williamsia sterculiae]|uniref:hypothetical protein n=1 Tax=Williamsia sterculiae TaxID=1344003 RepID=UPI000970E4A3|nr:hypothetical protein [Williamsia sterculiae]